jgi:hypothetical protein
LNEISPKAKEIFVSSVKNLGSLTASTKDLIEALTQWQPLLAGEYEGGDMSFAVSRRTSWLFPNGYILVISHSFGPHISHVDELIVWDSTPPVPEESKKNWKVENYANGWRPKNEPHEFPNTDVMLDLLEAMTEINGNPKLIIPWRDTWAQDIVDEGDYYLDPFEDSEIDPVRQAVQDMFKSVLAGKIDSQSPWEVEFTDGEAYLPSFCGYMELVKFLDEIEKQELAIVVRNVSVDYTKERDAEKIRAGNPQRAHLPIIWVPNDWAILTYFGNGWVNELVIYVADPELEKRMYILVEEMELTLYPRWAADEVAADGWKAVGSFQIGSDFD